MLDLIKRLIQSRRRSEDSEALAKRLGVRFGKDCKFIAINKHTFGSEAYLVTLGDHVEISSYVRFFTHDGGAWVFRDQEPELDFIGDIKVGNNVFIGHGAIILKGARISDNCVIGASAVVSGYIPPNSVAVGVPAKVIKSLEDYRESAQSSSFKTKNMGRDPKRRLLLQKFGFGDRSENK